MTETFEVRYQHLIIRLFFAICLAWGATTAHAQRIRLPSWSPERPEPTLAATASSADEPQLMAVRTRAGSDLDINIELPTEPRVASVDGPATLDTRGMSIADGFVNLDGWNQNCPTCPPAPSRRFSLFAAGLYLRPTGTNIAYAVEQTGCDPLLASPTGQVGTTSLDAQGGMRVGGSWFLPSGAEIVGTYTWLSNDTNSSIAAQGGTVLASLVTHPSLASCGVNSLTASASQDIDQQLIDLDYRVPLYADCFVDARYLAGIRYAQFDQHFSAQQLTGVATGVATVGTDVNFDGLGFHMGLEGERRSTHSGLFLYGRGMVNFLNGKFTARYSQVNQFGGAIPIGFNTEEYRIVSLLEGELGVGWQSRGGHWRLKAGYQTYTWLNMLTTSDYIRGARAGVIDDFSDTLTFDGLVAQVEWRR